MNCESDTSTDILDMLRDLQERFIVFINKLDDRLDEFCLTAVPELRDLRRSCGTLGYDEYSRAANAVLGQIDNICDRARKTHGERVMDVYRYYVTDIAIDDPLRDALDTFRRVCNERLYPFEEKAIRYRNVIKQIENETLAQEREAIIASFNEKAKRFVCSQCGAPLAIDKIYTIAVYIACPACGTQNLLEPGALARNLRFIERDLERNNV